MHTKSAAEAKRIHVEASASRRRTLPYACRRTAGYLSSGRCVEDASNISVMELHGYSLATSATATRENPMIVLNCAL